MSTDKEMNHILRLQRSKNLKPPKSKIKDTGGETRKKPGGIINNDKIMEISINAKEMMLKRSATTNRINFDVESSQNTQHIGNKDPERIFKSFDDRDRLQQTKQRMFNRKDYNLKMIDDEDTTHKAINIILHPHIKDSSGILPRLGEVMKNKNRIIANSNSLRRTQEIPEPKQVNPPFDVLHSNRKSREDRKDMELLNIHMKGYRHDSNDNNKNKSTSTQNSKMNNLKDMQNLDFRSESNEPYFPVIPNNVSTLELRIIEQVNRSVRLEKEGNKIRDILDVNRDHLTDNRSRNRITSLNVERKPIPKITHICSKLIKVGKCQRTAEHPINLRDENHHSKKDSKRVQLDLIREKYKFLEEITE